MNAFVARFDHSSRIGQAPSAARAVAKILMQPCFDVLKRLSRIREDRQSNYVPKSEKLIFEVLCESENESVVLDNGRIGPLIAKAVLATGHFDHGTYGLPAPFRSYIVIPLESGIMIDYVDACCQIAVALHCVAGSVTAERTFDEAESYALSMPARAKSQEVNGKSSTMRLRERNAHFYRCRNIDKQVAAPEWGLFLSEEHMKALPLNAIRRESAFENVQELVPGQLAFIQLATDIVNSIDANDERTYDDARRVLDPILMEPIDNA